MINPTPVSPKNTPYSTTNTRQGLPKSIAVQEPKSSKFNWKRLFLFSFFCLVLASGTYVYAQINSLKDSVIIQHEGESSSILGYEGSDKSNLDASLFKKAGDGRFNIAIVGVGGVNHPGGNLTDTIQVMSVDTINKKVGITSIPRDLYVNIPGYGYSKINSAYSVGEQQKPGEGALLLKQVLGNVTGVTISNFILMDFAGAKELVDALGGIDVMVPTAIYDPFFPDDQTVGYKPFSIKAGLQHMNGNTALSYSRSRETTSDFDRSARQQLVISAIKKKALSAGTLTNPAKLSDMLTALGQHIKTDMQTNDLKKFVSIYRDIPTENTSSFVLDTSDKLNLLTSSSGSAAGYISYPINGYGIYTQIQAWFQKNNSDPLIAREKATITVGAAANTTAKQLQSFVQILNDYGYSAIASSAKNSGTESQLFASNSQKPISKNYLNQYLGIKAISNSSLLNSGSDFEIIYSATKPTPVKK